MTTWLPVRETLRVRNCRVVSVSGGTAVVSLDGRHVEVPVYGPVAAGGAALLLEQGGSLLALGAAAAAAAEVDDLRMRLAAVEARLLMDGGTDASDDT